MHDSIDTYQSNALSNVKSNQSKVDPNYEKSVNLRSVCKFILPENEAHFHAFHLKDPLKHPNGVNVHCDQSQCLPPFYSTFRTYSTKN